MQQRLKPKSRATGAGIVAAELFDQLDVAVNEAGATFDVCLQRETISGDVCSRFQKQGRSSRFLGVLGMARLPCAVDGAG